MGETKAQLASRAWRDLSKLVLDDDRKTAVSDELGLSFARVRALRRLAVEPQTLKQLAKRLLADPPYITLIIDDLEQLGLVKRTPHPDDRRAKLVVLTATGRATAARADAIMSAPPAGLLELSADELARLTRLLERISTDQSKESE